MYWNDRRDQRNGQNITERAIHNNAMQNGVERRANIQRRRSAHRRTRAQPISSRMNDRKIGTYIAYVRQTVHEHGANKAQRARKPSTTELYNESSANINFVFPFIYSLRREISSYRFPSQKAIIYIGWFYNTVCSYLSLSLNAVYAVWPHITNAIRNDNWSKNGWIGSLSLSGRRDGKALLIDRTCTICPPPKCGYRTQEFSVTFNFVSHVNRTEQKTFPVASHFRSHAVKIYLFSVYRSIHPIRIRGFAIYARVCVTNGLWCVGMGNRNPKLRPFSFVHFVILFLPKP